VGTDAPDHVHFEIHKMFLSRLYENLTNLAAVGKKGRLYGLPSS
jgi:hypothetical protein